MLSQFVYYGKAASPMGQDDFPAEIEENLVFLKGEYKMKKKVLSLLVAVTLCMVLIAMPFTVSAATPIRDTYCGFSVYANVSYTNSYSQGTTQFGTTANYIAVSTTFTYGYNHTPFKRSADNDATGQSSVTVFANKDSAHTYTEGLGATAEHWVQYGSYTQWHATTSAGNP